MFAHVLTSREGTAQICMIDHVLYFSRDTSLGSLFAPKFARRSSARRGVRGAGIGQGAARPPGLSVLGVLSLPTVARVAEEPFSGEDEETRVGHLFSAFFSHGSGAASPACRPRRPEADRRVAAAYGDGYERANTSKSLENKPPLHSTYTPRPVHSHAHLIAHQVRADQSHFTSSSTHTKSETPGKGHS